MTRLDIAQEALKEGGLRMTSTRHAILQLIKEEEKYFTIEQIAEEAGERKMDTVTVYRIMQAFEELGLVHKLLSVNGFVAVDPNDQLYYAFFIDQDTHTVGRKVVEKIYLSGFESVTQYIEVLGSVTPIKTGENAQKQIVMEENTSSSADHDYQTGLKVTKSKGEDQKEQNNQSGIGQDRVQKKKLHQKLREF